LVKAQPEAANARRTAKIRKIAVCLIIVLEKYCKFYSRSRAKSARQGGRDEKS
jgi:hypothetical protein